MMSYIDTAIVLPMFMLSYIDTAIVLPMFMMSYIDTAIVLPMFMMSYIDTAIVLPNSGIGKATRHAQLALPSRLWRIEVRFLCAHVRPVNSD